MKINETHPREKGITLWGHCQSILDDPLISTIVGILTFISRINTAAAGSLKARKILIIQKFSFYMQLEFHTQ